MRFMWIVLFLVFFSVSAGAQTLSKQAKKPVLLPLSCFPFFGNVSESNIFKCIWGSIKIYIFLN